MSHFYFDTDDNDRFLEDREGQELPDRQAARNAALAALPDMARDHLPDGDKRTFTVTLRDDTRKAIYEASLTLAGKWVSPHC